MFPSNHINISILLLSRNLLQGQRTAPKKMSLTPHMNISSTKDISRRKRCSIVTLFLFAAKKYFKGQDIRHINIVYVK